MKFYADVVSSSLRHRKLVSSSCQWMSTTRRRTTMPVEPAMHNRCDSLNGHSGCFWFEMTLPCSARRCMVQRRLAHSPSICFRKYLNIIDR
jgi:hypothetical protein